MESKKNIQKGIFGLTALGLFYASCSDESLLPQTDEVTTRYAGISDDGNVIIPIELSKENIAYINFLNNLSRDIIKNPVVARQFAKDPSRFVDLYGYHEAIDLDEGMLKLVMTLGDEDVNNALQVNDLTNVIRIMEEKGYLEDIRRAEKKRIFTNSQLKEIYREMGIPADDNLIKQQEFSVVAVAAVYVIAVVVSQVGVGYNVAAVVNLSAVATVYAWVDAWGPSNNNTNITSTNLPLKIWGLRGDVEKTMIATNIYIAEQSHKMVEILKEQNSELLKYISEEDVEKLIKIYMTNSSVE